MCFILIKILRASSFILIFSAYIGFLCTMFIADSWIVSLILVSILIVILPLSYIKPNSKFRTNILKLYKISAPQGLDENNYNILIHSNIYSIHPNNNSIRSTLVYMKNSQKKYKRFTIYSIFVSVIFIRLATLNKVPYDSIVPLIQLLIGSFIRLILASLIDRRIKLIEGIIWYTFILYSTVRHPQAICTCLPACKAHPSTF